MIKLACMTLPYAAHPLERALEGISKAGYRYVAFGLAHAGSEVIDESDPASIARLQELFAQYALQPVMLVSTNQLAPGQPVSRIKARLQVAKQLGIQEIISLGTWNYRKFPDEPISDAEMEPVNNAFVEQFKIVAEEAAKLDLLVTIKPHCGNTATASHLIDTLDQIGSPFVEASYDPGNVEFYEGLVSHKDFSLVAGRTASIIAKDHRGERAHLEFPVPGTGDVDFANIFEAWKKAGRGGNVVVERVDGPTDAESIDQRMKDSRIQLEQLLRVAGFTLE